MREQYSKDESRSIRIGFYVIILVAVFSAFYVTNRTNIEHEERGKYYPLYARFGRTDGLSIGDSVRLAGIKVGRVVDAKLDKGFKAVLTLELMDKIKVPDDSSASIVSDGVLGSKYIEIEPGGSEDFIPQGGEFSYTQDAMVLEELLDRIISIGKSKNKISSVNEQKLEETFDE